jgi:uncharacterized membrane protein (UPF0182 family)
VDQDTEISRQLALWDQRGSRVIRGNLMVIPIEDSFIYVEPVFLIAEGVDIPQLQRVIVTTGDQVVMEPNLDQAIEALFGRAPTEAISEVAPAPVPIQPDSTRQAVPPAAYENFEELKSIWSELQTALQNGNWEQFGEKMEEIQDLLDEQ